MLKKLFFLFCAFGMLQFLPIFSTGYLFAEPTIWKIMPTSGKSTGGNNVALYLNGNFKSVKKVSFGDAEAVVTYFMIDYISVTAPKHDVGTVDIVVHGIDEQGNPFTSTHPEAYTYVSSEII